jgi:FkbM family methyltransferase
MTKSKHKIKSKNISISNILKNSKKTVKKTKVKSILNQKKPKILYNTQLLVKQEQIAAYKQGKGFGSKSIKEEVDNCISFLYHKPNIFIDIGAHKGYYTQEVLKQFPNIEAYLFEPSSANTEPLQIAFSKLHNVHISTYALSNITGKQKLYFDTQGSVLASLTKRRLDHFNVNFEKSEEIETIRFDEFWKTTQTYINNPNTIIDYVKIDVEGHELDVFDGFGSLIKQVGIIQFEFGGANIDTRTFFQDFWYFFKDKGFILYRIAPNGVIPIKNYIEIDEFFSTTNYIAVNTKINSLSNIMNENTEIKKQRNKSKKTKSKNKNRH